MTGSELYDLIDDFCHTDSTTYAVATKLRHLNASYGEVVGDILEVCPDFNFGGEIAKDDLKNYSGLVAGNKGYLGEYPLPDDFIGWVRAELMLDGSNPFPAKIYDTEENPLSEYDIDVLKGTGSKASPRIDIFRGSMFVRPLPDQDVTGGLILWYLSRQVALTANTSPTFEASYHKLLAYKAAKIWAQQPDSTYSSAWKKDINSEIAVLTAKLQAHYARLAVRPQQLTVPNNQTYR